MNNQKSKKVSSKIITSTRTQSKRIDKFTQNTTTQTIVIAEMNHYEIYYDDSDSDIQNEISDNIPEQSMMEL